MTFIPPVGNEIDIQLGWPSLFLFPSALLQEAANAVLGNEETASAALIYGPDKGYEPLRQNIAKWLQQIYGINEHVPADRIVITNGASASLGLIMLKFAEVGYTRKIWMVEPTYFLACRIFQDAGFGSHLCGVPEDEEGIDLEYLRDALVSIEAARAEDAQTTGVVDAPTFKLPPLYPKIYKHIIYTTPTFSNPSGKTMSLARRRALVQLAREFDALVISDDVYDVLRWPASPTIPLSLPLGPLLPRLIDIDRQLSGTSKFGNAISNGSFSKITAPGTRVGWIEATPDFVTGIAAIGSIFSGGSPSHLSATFLSHMLESGSLQRHINETLLPTYSKRYYVVIDAIKEFLLPLGIEIARGSPYTVATTSPSTGKRQAVELAGGFFIYIIFPPGLPPAKTIAQIAKTTQELTVARGELFAVAGDGESLLRKENLLQRSARICWSFHEEAQLREGIRRLGVIVKELLERGPETHGS